MTFAGLLDKTVEIQRKTLADDGYGGFTESWTTVALAAARIRPLAGNERLSADKLTVFATHRIYMEPQDITERDRIAWNGRRYEVRIVRDVDEQGRQMEIDAEEIV